MKHSERKPASRILAGGPLDLGRVASREIERPTQRRSGAVRSPMNSQVELDLLRANIRSSLLSAPTINASMYSLGKPGLRSQLSPENVRSQKTLKNAFPPDCSLLREASVRRLPEPVRPLSKSRHLSVSLLKQSSNDLKEIISKVNRVLEHFEKKPPEKKQTKSSKALRAQKSLKELNEPKSFKELKNLHEVKERKETRESKETKETKESKASKMPSTLGRLARSVRKMSRLLPEEELEQIENYLQKQEEHSCLLNFRKKALKAKLAKKLERDERDDLGRRGEIEAWYAVERHQLHEQKVALKREWINVISQLAKKAMNKKCELPASIDPLPNSKPIEAPSSPPLPAFSLSIRRSSDLSGRRVISDPEVETKGRPKPAPFGVVAQHFLMGQIVADELYEEFLSAALDSLPPPVTPPTPTAPSKKLKSIPCSAISISSFLNKLSDFLLKNHLPELTAFRRKNPPLSLNTKNHFIFQYSFKAPEEFLKAEKAAVFLLFDAFNESLASLRDMKASSSEEVLQAARERVLLWASVNRGSLKFEESEEDAEFILRVLYEEIISKTDSRDKQTAKEIEEELSNLIFSQILSEMVQTEFL